MFGPSLQPYQRRIVEAILAGKPLLLVNLPRHSKTLMMRELERQLDERAKLERIGLDSGGQV